MIQHVFVFLLSFHLLIIIVFRCCFPLYCGNCSYIMRLATAFIFRSAKYASIMHIRVFLLFQLVAVSVYSAFNILFDTCHVYVHSSL